MLKHIRVIFACIWFLLLTSMSHGFVEMDVFNATILIDTSEPIYNSYSFTGVSGSGTLTMKNGIMDDPSVDGVSSASITLNGVVVFDTGNFPGYGESSRRDITINEGANSLEIVSNGNVGAQFTIQIVQDWKEEASTVIGPGGGTLEVTDTESEALGVKIYVPENTFINDTELKISSFHSGIDTPLFPQYEEPVSTIVKLESSELPSSTVEICFPVIYFEDETYHRYELDEEVFEWNDSITDFEITLDNRGICAPIDHFSTYAITVKSNCSAPGGRFFSNNAEPTCRQKWESTIYQTILKPQLYMFAEKIYKNKIGSFLTPNDIVQASRATASQIAKLHDLNSKNIGEVWLQSRAEILQLAEKFFGNNFALIWFNFMLSALEEIAMGDPPLLI